MVWCGVQPRAVQDYLDEFSADAILSVHQAAIKDGKPVENLTIRQIGEALFGRRAVDPGL